MSAIRKKLQAFRPRPGPLPAETNAETRPNRVSFELQYLSQHCPNTVPHHVVASRHVRVTVNQAKKMSWVENTQHRVRISSGQTAFTSLGAPLWLHKGAPFHGFAYRSASRTRCFALAPGSFALFPEVLQRKPRD